MAKVRRAGLFAHNLSCGGTEKFAVLLARALAGEGYRVEVVTDRPVDAGRLERAFGSSLEGIALREIGSFSGGEKGFVASTAGYDLFINNSPLHAFPSFARRSLLWVHYLPKWVPRHLKFYTVLANSRHTQRWVRARWKTDAELLYGPVDVARLRPAAKEKIIMSSGRLHSRPVPKNELRMIRLFAALHRAGRLPGWSYHLAGLLQRPDAAWLSKLRAAAGGAPVHIRVNQRFEDLAELYGRASLLWHGCGAQVDGNLRPERVEHFGIAIVEAMASGCLPIAPRNGGPAELIRDGRTGFLYDSWDEMIRKTVDAADAGGPLRAMRAGARAAASQFSVRRFREALKKHL